MRRSRLVLVGALLVAAAAVYWFTRVATVPVGPGPGEGRHPRHLLLITIDTLRADHVGAYGWTRARTPTLDGLAGRGIRFTHAYAAAPITLTSHATILTGRYPPGHGARHNGIAVRAEVPTLAEHLRRAGYSTGAFVSAFPLDKRFGLARGFDVYDDELPRGGDGRPSNERAGAVTVDRAIAWARSRPADARRFAWVHLFEPHAPYTPDGAAPDASRSASDRYDGEIAVADREIGRLLAAWPDIAHTLVIATADHGEAFGEHGETGHSIFVYDTTLRVPLILSGWPVPGGVVSDLPVSLVDLAPTIVNWLRLTAFDSDGIDVMRAVNGGSSDRALYAESFAPLLDFGWAPLRSLRREGIKLIAAPRSELYDLRSDGGEEHNIIDARAETARELMTRVDRISSAELPSRADAATDPEAAARLRALGYAGGSRTASAGARPDPKDRIGVASRMAQVTSGELQGAAAERALNEVLRDDPGNTQAHLRLGYVLAQSGRCAAAERHFAAAIAGGLASADAHLGLAMCEAERGASAAALATLRDARRVEPGNPVVEANIGLAELDAGRVDAAVGALRTALRSDPNLHQARFALARALARSGQREAARAEAAELLARLPASAPQRGEVERLLAALR